MEYLRVSVLKKNLDCVIKKLHQRTKGRPYIGFYLFEKACIIRNLKIVNEIFVEDLITIIQDHLSSVLSVFI